MWGPVTESCKYQSRCFSPHLYFSKKLGRVPSELSAMPPLLLEFKLTLISLLSSLLLPLKDILTDRYTSKLDCCKVLCMGRSLKTNQKLHRSRMQQCMQFRVPCSLPKSHCYCVSCVDSQFFSECSSGFRLLSLKPCMAHG